MIFNHQSFCIYGRNVKKRNLFRNSSCWLRILDVQSKHAYVTRTVHGLHREEEPCHTSSLEHTPARLEDSRESPQRSGKRRSTAELAHARMLKFEELGIAASDSNTLDYDFEPQVFAEASKSEVGMDLIRVVAWPPGTRAICWCSVYKTKKNKQRRVYLTRVV